MNLLTYRILTSLALPLVAYSAWQRCRKHKKAWQTQQNAISQNEPLKPISLTSPTTPTNKTSTETSLSAAIPEIPYCFKSRFGFNPSKMQKGGIWLHAVSVGETRSIFGLLEQLKQQHPSLPITLTNSSIQGAVHASQFCPIAFQHQMLPLDYPFAINRLLDQIKPKLVMMVETEIWPNLYRACQQRDIPIVLINARLKASSHKAYKKWGGQVIKNALNEAEWIGVQSKEDAERFADLGVKPDKIKALGNLKSDIKIPNTLLPQAQEWRTQNTSTSRPIWVAASTHADPNDQESEESLILQAHQQLLTTFPDTLLIIVPRHAARFDEVAELIAQKGFSYQRRSSQKDLTPTTQVYLADSLGEMMLWYAIADIAFVGGSLVPFGGHNILEPAALKTPIISGQHFTNLTSMFAPFISAQAIHIIHSPPALAEQIKELLAQKEKAAQLTETAFNVMQQQTGALEATLQEVNALLD